MASKKTYFSKQWLYLYPEFANWASKAPGHKEQTFCKVCKKLLRLGNMGKKALVTHSKIELHKNLVKCSDKQKLFVSFFHHTATTSGKPSSSGCSFVSSTSMTTEAASTEASHQDPVHVPSLDKLLVPYYIKEDVTRAEIVWALKVVDSRYSKSSCYDISDLFSFMFPDSNIAKQFSLGETKCSYVINHGIAPSLSEILEGAIQD
ncbi:hypothetical protein PR048_019630 [Dryococelus australis]|uniref:BED-type domain-containing protein n=1 Tax=Dryococelus australis TaxID=614101 RepID=A0ABQ9H435_9NEOP|nr:hypothetical protein PR048_019630 [Dryococelus australis]